MSDITHILKTQKLEVSRLIAGVATMVKEAYVTMYIDIRTQDWKGQLWTGQAVFDDLDEKESGEAIDYEEDVKRAIGTLFLEFSQECGYVLKDHDITVNDINFVEVRTTSTITLSDKEVLKGHAAAEYNNFGLFIDDLEEHYSTASDKLFI